MNVPVPYDPQTGVLMVQRYINLLALRCPIPILVWGKPNPGERSVWRGPEPSKPLNLSSSSE